MATKVLDSWALIAFFEDEPAAERVERLLVKAEAGTHDLLLCVVNWGRDLLQHYANRVSGGCGAESERDCWSNH